MKTFLRLAVSLISSLGAFACTDASSPKGVDVRSACYASPDGRLLRSTLIVEPEKTRTHLTGTTELRAEPATKRADFTTAPDDVLRIVEKATLDASGNLVHYSATISAARSERSASVELDPARGRAEIETASAHTVWSVPRDLPWVLVPILTEPLTRAPVATPLDGEIALYATASGGAVRRIDLGALSSYPVTADQIRVPDDNRATLVLGDDVVEVENGRLTAVHLAALGTRLEEVDSGALAYAPGIAQNCNREPRE
jgi:hypothetical protein